MSFDKHKNRPRESPLTPHIVAHNITAEFVEGVDITRVQSICTGIYMTEMSTLTYNSLQEKYPPAKLLYQHQCPFRYTVYHLINRLV
jgi:hypothetical protein